MDGLFSPHLTFLCLFAHIDVVVAFFISFQNYIKEFDELPMKSMVLKQLVEWAKHIPHFTDLKIEDQVRRERSRPLY